MTSLLLRLVQHQASAERTKVRDLAVDHFIAGETAPIELRTYLENLKSVLLAGPGDDVPSLPEKPAILDGEK